jgi:two-component SAPR family response regulator
VKGNITALEKVQTQAARFCMKEYNREPGTVTNLMAELDWQSLQTRRKIARVSMFYKMVNGLVEIDLENFAQKANRQTRGHNQKYQTVGWNLAAWRDSFFPATIKDWNELPPSVVGSTSIDTFKTAVREAYASN